MKELIEQMDALYAAFKEDANLQSEKGNFVVELIEVM